MTVFRSVTHLGIVEALPVGAERGRIVAAAVAACRFAFVAWSVPAARSKPAGEALTLLVRTCKTRPPLTSQNDGRWLMTTRDNDTSATVH